ncbi:hypothetical protein [Devosia sp.]|uniref:hypothetical protein n=1 Tax=Devosia sp. TaxID=1871048 RepID=UPI002FC75E4A
MVEIISFLKVLDYEQLLERLRILRRQVNRAHADSPDRIASPTLTATTAAVLADTYRLISREPGARSLSRLAPDARPTHRQLVAMLGDVELKLDMFKHVHHDHHDEYGQDWMTIEGIEAFREDRKKTYPRS